MKKHINTGKPFEAMLEMVFEHYQYKDIAKIHKVDPPTKTFLKNGKRFTINLESPFMDYIGVENGTGRCIIIEAKSTAPGKRTLPIGKGGLTRSQVERLLAWYDAEAMAMLLWECGGEVVELNPLQIHYIIKVRKHLKWDDGIPLQRGKGKEIWRIIK